MEVFGVSINMGQIYQLAIDGGSFTAIADEAVYAGAFLKPGTSNDAVTSLGLSSYVTSDIKVMLCNAAGDDSLCIGIAAEDASSGDYLTVYTEGLYIVRQKETSMTAGVAVTADETDYFEIAAVGDGEEEFKIGKILTGASAANKYVIMKLNV